MRVRFTRGSKRDLADIALYISRDSENRALTYIDELQQACLTLAENADRFGFLTGREHVGLRRRPYGRYLIIYRVSDDTVMIHRIVSSALDTANLLIDIPEDEEGF